MTNTDPRPSENQPCADCPNCRVSISLNSSECPHCHAVFGVGSAWKLTPNGQFADFPVPAIGASTSLTTPPKAAEPAPDASPSSVGPRLSDDQFRERSRAILSFEGRIGRMRYLAATVLLLTGATVALLGLPMLSMTMCSGSQSDQQAFTRCMDGALGFTGLVMLAVIPTVVLYFSYVIRRLHDFNASGWLSVFFGLPLVNLFLYFIPGNLIENDNGPPPLPSSKLTVAIGTIGAAAIAGVWGMLPVLQRNYGEYEVRARVFGATDDIMQATRKIVATSGALPNRHSDLQLDIRNSRIIESVDVEADGKITVVFKLNPKLGNQLVLQPRLADGAVSWTCTDGTLPLTLRSSSCKSK